MAIRIPKPGDIIGFDIDIAKEVCSFIGIELRFSPLIGTITSNWKRQWTAQNASARPRERDEQFNFKHSLYEERVDHSGETDSDYQTFRGPVGKIIGVQADSSAESALRPRKQDFKDSLKEIVKLTTTLWLY